MIMHFLISKYNDNKVKFVCRISAVCCLILSVFNIFL